MVAKKWVMIVHGDFFMGFLVVELQVSHHAMSQFHLIQSY